MRDIITHSNNLLLPAATIAFIMDWKELQKYDGNPPDKALPRDKAIATRYGYYLKSFKRRGTTVGKFILENIFERFENMPFVITLNDYPYKVSDDIKHLVVWTNPLFVVLEKDIRSYLKDRIGNKFVLFKNLTDHKSVVEADHYQLFVEAEQIEVEAIKLVKFERVSSATSPKTSSKTSPVTSKNKKEAEEDAGDVEADAADAITDVSDDKETPQESPVDVYLSE